MGIDPRIKACKQEQIGYKGSKEVRQIKQIQTYKYCLMLLAASKAVTIALGKALIKRVSLHLPI